MNLDHLLAMTPQGAPLDETHHAKAAELLSLFGFSAHDGRWVLDDTVAWITIEPQDGQLRVHVQSPVPEHVIETAARVCDALVREAGLVRIDPLWHREISAQDWSQRLAEESRRAYRKSL